VVFEAIRQLMAQPESPRKRIGFMARKARVPMGWKKAGRQRKTNLRKGEEPDASGDKSAGFYYYLSREKNGVSGSGLLKQVGRISGAISPLVSRGRGSHEAGDL
jgi:hypothetical protein